MSEDENEKKPIKLKLSGTGKDANGEKQSAAPASSADAPQEQAGGQSPKPTRLELRRKPKKQEDAAAAPKQQEDPPPEPEPKPETDSAPDSETKTPAKPRLKPRPDPDQPEEAAPQEEPDTNETSPVDENPFATGLAHSSKDSDTAEEDASPDPPEKPKLKTQPPAEEGAAPETPEEPARPAKTSESPGAGGSDPAPVPTQAPTPTPTPALPEEEEDASANTPPPLSVGSKAPVEEQPEETPEDLEESVRGVANAQGSSSSSLWLSVIIIFVLLAVLGGSGLGLWYVLKDPGDQPGKVAESEPPADDGSASASESQGNSITGPIAKATEAVESVPTEALDEVISEEPSPRDQAQRPPEDANGSSTKSPEPKADAAQVAGSQTEPTGATRQIADPAGADQELVQTVSNFLSQVHIGGVRTGERPMVIVDGQNHTPGGVVDPETGLRFTGIRSGKLAFTDKNGVVYLKSF